VVGGVPGEPGSRWHTTYEKACAGPSFSREREGTYIKHCLNFFKLYAFILLTSALVPGINCECATAA